MSELQAEESTGVTFDSDNIEAGKDSATIEATESETTKPETEAVDSGADLATAEPEEVNDNTKEAPTTATVDGVVVEGPNGFAKAINKKHRFGKEQERRAENAEKELTEMKERLNALEAPADLPIPDLPDPWSDDYQEKVAQREAGIRQSALREHEAKVVSDREQAVQQEAQAKAQADNTKKMEVLRDRALKVGIKEVDLIEAANIVSDYKVSPEVAEFLVTEEDGAQMISYLAENPAELEALAGMGNLAAGTNLTSNIRAKAKARFEPKASSAPDPATTVKGGIPTGNKYGATFE